jgi:spermidine synthase
MDPHRLTPNVTTSRPLRKGLASALLAVSIASLFFELLVVLGIIVQPLPKMGGLWSVEWLAAFAACVCSGALALYRDHRLTLSDGGVMVLVLLLAHCAGAFSQMTTVLVPRTVIPTAADAATHVVTAAGTAITHAAALGLAACLVAVWTSYGDAVFRAGPRLLAASFVGAVLCLFVPVASAPYCASVLSNLSPSAVAAATTPARLGAICFPLLWVTIVLVDALRMPRTPGAAGSAWKAAMLAATLLVLGLAIKFEPKPSLSIPLALALGVLAHLPNLAVRLRARELTPAAMARATTFSRSDLGLIFVFFVSGMAALVYQVVFAKGLALTFGSTSHASTIVLATYMSGLALGSWLGGRFAERVTRPIFVYAGAELGIALVCAFAPLTLKAARAVYVMIASGADPAESWLVGLQLGLGALVLIPPTLLMGVTLPMLTRHLIARRDSLGVSAGVLYSSNTLGAAAGALTTGYLMMPALGVTASLRVAVALNIAVAAIALMFGRGLGVTRPAASQNSDDPTAAVDEPTAARDIQRTLGWIALAQLTVGGFVTFGLETTFVHLLATIAGNSAYAFSLMLFAFLIGLGVGSNVARRWLHSKRDFASALLLCQALLALTLLLGVPFWDGIPSYFAIFGPWAPAKSFAARELIRFLACLVVMLPPALFIGAQFPIAMDVIGRAWSSRRIAALGFASALNTVGNILGALVVGFMFLPKLGSLGTLHLLIIACLFLAALSIPYTTRKLRPVVSVLLIVEAGLYLKQPAQFDLTTLASGGNVYFQWQQYGRVIDSAESLDGGLTTVAISGENRTWAVLTLLTNGKFQGDDSTGGEMKAQSSFALAPLLHTQQRKRALVIGFGTGTTTKVLHQAAFERIDVAELSGDILSLADRHFRAVNEGVLHKPEVRTHVTDGRNFLLLDQARYDAISIELSSIWFAGAANLYNREFYQLVRARLAPGGVFQQWVQLHRLAESDIATVLTTLSEQFPNVWLYFLGKQGILLACVDSCQPNRQTLNALDQSPELASTLKLFDGHAAQVLKGRILTPQTLKKLVDDARREFGSGFGPLIATDDNVTLEYSTPKGNVRKYDESLDQNLRYLDKYKEPDLFAATALTLRDAPYLAD